MFDHYYRELMSFLARRVQDRETAADLTQESFARVYAAERSGMVIRDPRALLYKTARNLVIDEFRRDNARGGRSECSESAVALDVHAGPVALEPEIALAGRQRFEAVVTAIETLPPRCREVFVAVKFGGLAHAEVAKRMGISVKTVEMQMRIALAKCSDILDVGNSKN